MISALYQYIKDVADNECKRWLCSVNLAIHVRDGITKANGKTYARVRKCFIANSDLFQAQFHKKTVDELTVAVSRAASKSYFKISCRLAVTFY